MQENANRRKLVVKDNENETDLDILDDKRWCTRAIAQAGINHGDPAVERTKFIVANFATSTKRTGTKGKPRLLPETHPLIYKWTVWSNKHR